jgi:hypothetical protein
LASTLDRLQAIRAQSACLINAPSEVKESAFRTSFTERVKIDCSECGLDGLSARITQESTPQGRRYLGAQIPGCECGRKAGRTHYAHRTCPEISKG